MRLQTLAASALVGLTLAACTSTTSGSPTTPPRLTHSATSSRTTPPPVTKTPTTSPPTVPTTGPNVRPGEKPPSLPAVARTRTRAGAITFAQFWFQTWDWAYATTNASLMMEFYSKSCSDCALAAGQFAKARSKGEHYRGGRLYFKQSGIVDSDRRHQAQYAVDVTEGQKPLEVIDGAGKVVQRNRRVNHITFRVYLRWLQGSWKIVYKAHVV